MFVITNQLVAGSFVFFPKFGKGVAAIKFIFSCYCRTLEYVLQEYYFPPLSRHCLVCPLAGVSFKLSL